jgi:hypothetical protein
VRAQGVYEAVRGGTSVTLAGGAVRPRDGFPAGTSAATILAEQLCYTDADRPYRVLLIDRLLGAAAPARVPPPVSPAGAADGPPAPTIAEHTGVLRAAVGDAAMAAITADIAAFASSCVFGPGG